MGNGIEGLEQAYEVFFIGILIFLAVMTVLCLVRAIIGPRIADRIVAVNMMGTMVIVMIAVLSLMLGEEYLADICVIYAMISFLAVIVLTKVYMGVYLERREAEKRAGSGEAGGERETGRNREIIGNQETDVTHRMGGKQEIGKKQEPGGTKETGEKRETDEKKETDEKQGVGGKQEPGGKKGTGRKREAGGKQEPGGNQGTGGKGRRGGDGMD